MARLAIERENFEFNKLSSLDVASMSEKNVNQVFDYIDI